MTYYCAWANTIWQPTRKSIRTWSAKCRLSHRIRSLTRAHSSTISPCSDSTIQFDSSPTLSPSACHQPNQKLITWVKLPTLLVGDVFTKVCYCLYNQKEIQSNEFKFINTDGPLPSKMQQVSVPVINNTECENMYRRAGYVEHIPNIFICAGYAEGKRDSCEVTS